MPVIERLSYLLVRQAASSAGVCLCSVTHLQTDIHETLNVHARRTICRWDWRTTPATRQASIPLSVTSREATAFVRQSFSGAPVCKTGRKQRVERGVILQTRKGLPRQALTPSATAHLVHVIAESQTPGSTAVVTAQNEVTDVERILDYPLVRKVLTFERDTPSLVC